MNYRTLRVALAGFIVTIGVWSCNNTTIDSKPTQDLESLMIRMAEIEIDSNYFEAYTSILKEESEASIRLETGVICIYPMYTRDNPTQIRLLEIYASREAYESHIQSEHFQKYKTSTLHMVTSLKLIDMEPIDLATMPEIFSKLNRR